MKLVKRVCNDEMEVSVAVIDQPTESETMIGFENRMVSLVNRLAGDFAEVDQNADQSDD